ncbi:MAG: heat-inducible transcription repressor HrcA [Gammaproteobacteria bacterium]|nr:heat-inducible transcription repressor HrcA [Gammaproteobacteria bacterium]
MQAAHLPPILTERTRHIFKVLVEHYIKTGSPVGSRTLSDYPGIHFSSATIRTILSDLEEQGFVCSTHTSSGRVPTTSGYHFFVDQLLMTRPTLEKEVEFYEQQWNRTFTTNEVIKMASSLLSALTKLVGLVMLPKKTKVILRKVEFLPLSSERILAILVMNEADVQSWMLPVERSYTPRELEQASHHLNTHYSGMELKEICTLLSKNICPAHQKLDVLVEKFMTLAVLAFAKAEEAFESSEGYVVNGQTQLLEFCEAHNLRKMRGIFEALEQKKILLHLFNQCVEQQTLQLFIGREVGHKLFDDYAFVALPYAVQGERVGALGVIGPMRMAYERVISTVHLVSKLLSRVLERKEVT